MTVQLMVRQRFENLVPVTIKKVYKTGACHKCGQNYVDLASNIGTCHQCGQISVNLVLKRKED